VTVASYSGKCLFISCNHLVCGTRHSCFSAHFTLFNAVVVAVLMLESRLWPKFTGQGLVLALLKESENCCFRGSRSLSVVLTLAALPKRAENTYFGSEIYSLFESFNHVSIVTLMFSSLY
jgi:hypothetical protein